MAPADTATARLRSGAVSAHALERSAALTLLLLWLVIATGGLVRLTASGLGCTDWPNCEEGSLVPAGSYHAVIEYSNRLVSGVAVVSTVITAVLAYRVAGLPRRPARAALAVAAGTVAQAPLGAVTVATDLHPLAVMSHFLLAIATLGGATWVLFHVNRFASGPVTTSARALTSGSGWTLVAWGTVVACLGLVTTGAFVTAAGPHPGSTDQPIERLGSFEDATYVHVRAAVAFSLLFVVLTVWLWRTARGSLVQRLSLAGVILTLCQLALGEYQYRNGLPWQVIAVHVTVAATLVITVVTVACLVAERERGSPERG